MNFICVNVIIFNKFIIKMVIIISNWYGECVVVWRINILFKKLLKGGKFVIIKVMVK